MLKGKDLIIVSSDSNPGVTKRSKMRPPQPSDSQGGTFTLEFLDHTEFTCKEQCPVIQIEAHCVCDSPPAGVTPRTSPLSQPFRGGFTNFYRRFPGDYLRDTQHLSLSQHGIYCLLLDTLYATEKPIKDRQSAYRICRCSEHDGSIADCNAVIAEFFEESARGIWHSKVEKEAKYAESRRLTARAGASSRWAKDAPSNAPSIQRAMLPDTRHQTPDKEESKPKPKGVEIPDAPIWMPAETWLAYIEMRREKKAKITPKAALIIFKKLAAWMELGMDPKEVLEQSIMNGWTGIFELKKNSGGKNERLTAEEAFRRNVETFKKHNLEKPN